MKSLPRPPVPVTWNPADYAAHSASQLAWARELIARLELRGDERVLDVGCGDGKITAELARSVPRGRVVGVDRAAEMIRFARRTFPTAQFPNLEFHVMDARELRLPAPIDLLFSNATLHWVDDHPAFLRGAAACVRPGGRLAISCGGRGNAQEVFRAVRTVLRREHYRRFFRKMTAAYFFHAPEDYHRWLPRAGFVAQRVRLAEKIAHFPGREGLAAWLRTTWLPYTQRVPDAQRDEFVAAVVERYVARHPAGMDGELAVRMVRLEIEATRMTAPPTPRRTAIDSRL